MQGNKQGNNKPRVVEKQKDMLLTVLAFQAPKESVKLLMKHNPNVKIRNYEQIEYELGNLYVNSTDKVGLEKEFAQIHPHRDWLLKYIAVPTKMSVVADEVKIEDVPAPIQKEQAKQLIQEYSNFDSAAPKSNVTNNQDQNNNQNNQKSHISEGVLIIGVLSIVAVIGLISMHHSHNSHSK